MNSAGSCETAKFEARADGVEHCTYCGSLTIAEATRRLTTTGTSYSGSDWKYGFPHKFYIGDGKFYSVHAATATTAELSAWNEAAIGTVGVFLLREDGTGKLRYKCPASNSAYGFQAAGTVGS